MKVFLGIVVVLILLVVGVVGYLGFIPGVSSLFGSDKARDLGVTHTEADLASAQEKLKQTSVDSVSLASATSSQVETTLTQEEYSAHIEKVHPLRDVQVKLSDQDFEMSAVIDKERIESFVKAWGVEKVDGIDVLKEVDNYVKADTPIYLKGSGTVENNDITLDLESAELGRAPVPTDQAKMVIEKYTETLLNQFPSFKVEVSKIVEGALFFKGSIPSQIPRY